MIEVLAVRNCKYVKADNSVIDCEAKFSHLGDSSQDWLPFTATNSDTEEHGRAVYTNAVNGDYGTVTAFSRTLDEELRDIRLKRRTLLEETDFYANSDVTMSDDMRTYRQNLRDITNGLDTVEKAQNVTWPTKP